MCVGNHRAKRDVVDAHCLSWAAIGTLKHFGVGLWDADSDTSLATYKKPSEIPAIDTGEASVYGRATGEGSEVSRVSDLVSFQGILQWTCLSVV